MQEPEHLSQKAQKATLFISAENAQSGSKGVYSSKERGGQRGQLGQKGETAPVEDVEDWEDLKITSGSAQNAQNAQTLITGANAKSEDKGILNGYKVLGEMGKMDADVEVEDWGDVLLGKSETENRHNNFFSRKFLFRVFQFPSFRVNREFTRRAEQAGLRRRRSWLR